MARAPPSFSRAAMSTAAVAAPPSVAPPSPTSDIDAEAAAAPAPAAAIMERSGNSSRNSSSSSSTGGGGVRMHSTVRLNQFTLRFEDAALESAYQASIHRRKKALWLRSLIPAAGSHILFGLGDCLEHPVANLQVTLPARVFLAVLQIAMFILVKWDLIQAHETTMLLVSICNGVPSLLIYALQRSSLHQWDALFVIYGLSFYTIPKITPLGFISSTGGSWATAVLYTLLAFVVRPPARMAESVVGLLYCAPVIGIFNTIAYYSEYNSRERFVLRRRLSSESISLAVARTNTLALADRDGTNQIFKMLAHSNGPTFFFGVVLWGAFTLGGWASLPDTLKFVDEETGWAWFSHCAGVTMFLLVMTRQLKWLFVVPVLGSLVLWMMSLTMPSEWIIFSAHSVGYGLLLASVVIAMGVFSWFVCAWRELVSFLTRSCFLYPQLQAGLETEYPLLVKIVSEYTAGFDPEILSSRLPATQAIGSVAEVRAALRASADSGDQCASHGLQVSMTSPRRRHQPVVKAKLLVDSGALRASRQAKAATMVPTLTEYAGDAEVELMRPEALVQSPLVVDRDVPGAGKMVSVLPSFKAGKCFFCSKNDAEHFVPACGMWGKWTHWRMHQQHGSSDVVASGAAAAAASRVAKPIVSMCTSYYDIQSQKRELELELARVDERHALVQKQLEHVRASERETVSANVQLHAELRALEDRSALERQRHDAQWQQKTKALLEDANRVAHERKLELKRADAARVALAKELEEAKRLAEAADARARELEQSREQEAQRVEALERELAAHRASLGQASSSDSGAALAAPASSTAPGLGLDAQATAAAAAAERTSAASANLQTLQPSKRLPYAQFLEIEGLRESSRKRDGSTDYSQHWRFGLASPSSPPTFAAPHEP